MEAMEVPFDPESLDGNALDNEEATSAAPPSTTKKQTSNPHSKSISSDTPFESHFSLRIPTSTVHFRGSLLRVIDTDQDQIVLQELNITDDDDDNSNNTQGANKDAAAADDDPENKRSRRKILVKRMNAGTYAQRFLRGGYTLITILFLGFLFVFCFQVLLFLFIALPVESGYSSNTKEVDGVALVSTLLSFPVMLYGMSSLMAMGSAFVVDTWNGGVLFKSTALEMVYMTVFLVVPILTFTVSLMAKSEEAWRIAALTWAGLVSALFAVFGLAVTYREAKACFWLVEKHFNLDQSNESSEEQGKWKRWMTIAKKALLLTQSARYSGTRNERYHVAGHDNVGDLDGGGSFSSSPDHSPVETNMSLYSRITALSFWPMFETLDPPKRVYRSEEVHDILPFMTKHNWSMQKMWCTGDSRRRSVIVARGPAALTADQVKYAALCSVTSTVLATLLIIGFLAWMATGPGSYIVVAVISMFCCIVPMIKNNREMYDMYHAVNDDHDENDDEDDAAENFIHVWETVRITQPKPWYCYARVVIEIIFLFFWPFIAMLVTNNRPVALVFLLLGSFTFIWKYFDANAVFVETGSMSKVFNSKDYNGDDDHLEKHRLSEIVGRIINNKGRRWWTWIFFVFFLAILFLFLASQNSSDLIQPGERATRPPILLLDDFYYPPVDDTIAYPSCTLNKGFEFPGIGSTDLVDYAFLSAMAYETSNATKVLLGEWFGPDMVVDEEEFVADFRQESGTWISPVYFKLFSFQNAPGVGVVSIRGSETSFDWIVNMQLWSSSGLAQVIKWITPYGWVWSPIIPDLIKWVNLVESQKIKDVAYYKVTTQFVNEVLAGYGDSRFSTLRVTGVSLGGGLAIITGAQTDAYTVAISGMGASLARKSFDPPISLDKLNAQTFNFIPERDYIAKIGGRSSFFQNGQCTAPKNDLFGCHSLWRSVCEISYRCGSNGRPVVCRCVKLFGYPVPTPNGTRSFEEACEEAESTWYETFPQ